MQKSKSKCKTMDRVFKENKKRNHRSWRQEKNRTTKSRQHIFTRRFIKERHRAPFKPKQRDDVVRCDLHDGEPTHLYYFGTEKRGIYINKETEDSDIDNSQSQGWRGG